MVKFSVHLNRHVFVMKAVVAVLLFCASVVSYVVFVFSVFVPHLFLFWCLGRVVLCVCGFLWISSLIFVSPSEKGDYFFEQFVSL